MADSLPLQPQRPETPPSERSLGSAPTVAGSAPGAGRASTVSEPTSATGGDTIRGMRETLQKKKQALVARKCELDGAAPVLASYSDEATDDLAWLHQKLREVRGRLEVLNPIIAQLDADYLATAEQLNDGKTTTSETDMRLLAKIDVLRSTVARQEAEKGALEQQLDQLDARCAELLQDDSTTSRPQVDALRQQRRPLEARLVKTLADLEVNKLDACAMMHEAVALVDRARRHGEPLVDAAPGYVSDQGTSSGYASEVPSRTPFACESHEPMAPWSAGSRAGGGSPIHGVGDSMAGFGADGSDANARPAPATAPPPDQNVILPWNMRPAANYYFLPPGGVSAATPPTPVTDDAFDSPMGCGGGGGHPQPPDDASYDGPTPYTADSLKRIFEAGTPHPDSLATVGDGARPGVSDSAISMTYATNLGWHAIGPTHWNTGQQTPLTPDGNEMLHAVSADDYGSSPSKRGRPTGYYTEGLRWDTASGWPVSRATPNRSQEQLDSLEPTSEERIRGVAQQMMARVPQSRPSSSGQPAVTGYMGGPLHWPPSPPTPLALDTVTVDPERRTVVVRHGRRPPPGYTSGLAWTGPTDWPGSSCATPAPPSQETVVGARPPPGYSVSVSGPDHSSSETLVQAQGNGSPRREVNLPWNVQPASNYTAPTGESTAMPVHQLLLDATHHDGPAPYSAASLQRIFDEGVVHEAPSIYYTPPQECCSKEDYYTPFQSANEMFGDSSASEQELEPEHEQTMRVLEPGSSSEAQEFDSKTPSGHSLTDGSQSGSFLEWERFQTRSAQLMSRYEGVQPCLPHEALQRRTDACSEPFSSPRDDEPDRAADSGYEPAQGQYGYQRYPEGYQPPQMWYGHDQVSLQSDASSEDAAGTYAKFDYTQSQFESEDPTSTSETLGMASLVTQNGERPDYDGPSPDTTRTLASIFEDGTGRAGCVGSRERRETGPGDGYVSPSEHYEPAQGEYGYQRYPQGYEPAQMWYGYDHASLPGQPPVGTLDFSDRVPASTDRQKPCEAEDNESVSPDNKKTLANIFQDGTPYAVQGKEPVPCYEMGGGGPPGASQDGDEPYEPAQGEYGYQRYPQGYEPAQMWYGHDRVSLPGQPPAGTYLSIGETTTSTSGTAPVAADDYESVSPDSKKTLQNFQDGTPYSVKDEDSGPDSVASAPLGGGWDGGEPYELAQGEYGYQRYPQGYEPAQMWYGHDRASLPGQKTIELVSAVQLTSAGCATSEKNHDGIQPDTTKTLAQIFEDSTPHDDKPTVVNDSHSTSSTVAAAEGEPLAASQDEELAVACQDDQSRWSETSVNSAETPVASRSMEYIPASGMYGFQPLIGPPSRGSLEHLRPSDGTYTQGLCVWQCPDTWPPTPSTPDSSEHVSEVSVQPVPEVTAEYMEGLRWDDPGKNWPQTPKTPDSRDNLPALRYAQGLRWDHTKNVPAPTPPTPDSRGRSQQTCARPASDGNFGLFSPDSTPTMTALFEEGTTYMAHRKSPHGDEGKRYETAQGEYGYQRYEPAQMWHGHDRASAPSPRSSQDLSSQAVSSTDPSPAITPRPTHRYEPAQGIYGFQKVFFDAAKATSSARAAAVDSAENLDGPCPDTSRSLERIFEAGTATPGEQRPLTPSPNLPAFLEKLASSSESEDSAGRRRGRPADSVPAVRVPRNRFYSMEEMCTTAPSQSSLSVSSATSHGRETPRPGEQQCYLPWTHRASVPYREPQGTRFLEDYQEPPLVEMDDQISFPTPTSSRPRRSDTEKASEEKSPHSVSEELLQRLRSLESRLHLMEDESQSKDRQIQELLSRLEALLSSTGDDAQDDLAQRLKTASETVTKLELTESKLGRELEKAKKEIESYILQLESFKSRSAELELRLAESQRMQAAGDQQLQQLAQQCGQLSAERDQLARQLEESCAGVAEKEERVEGLVHRLQEYSERVAQLEKDMNRNELPADKRDVAAENNYLKGRVAELEHLHDNDEHWKEQAHEAGERARAMEKALDRLSSEKWTEEERRREVEAQLVQLVRGVSAVRPAEDTPAEESGADELLDPQLCRRLHQLLIILHSEGLQALNMVELRFVKLYASPSQLTPRPQADASVVDVADMETATLRRVLARLVSELKDKQDNVIAKVSELASSLQEEQVQVRDLQTALDAEHRSKLALTGCLGEQRSALGAMETDLAQALSELRGGEERLDQTRSSLDSRLHEFAAAKTATQQLVEREERVMQELIRTTDASCQDLQRVQACLTKLDGVGERVGQLCARPDDRGALQRLVEQLLAEQQRCRDMLAYVECERGRAAQLCRELDQGRDQTPPAAQHTARLEQRVAEQQRHAEKLEQQIEATCTEVRRAGPDGSKALEQKLRRLQQEVRQVQAAHRKAADDMQRPAADRSQDTARLCRSSAQLLIAVTAAADTNGEAERARTRLLQLATELVGRDNLELTSAPAPTPAATPAPGPVPAPTRVMADSDPALASAADQTTLTRYKEQLESERAQWVQERRLLQSHIDQLDAELERLRMAARPEPVSPRGEGDDGRVQEAHSRYMRAESYRRALCWQKRYLMILLGGYQETETMTLEKMVQLTGGCFLPDYRRLLQPVRKFRAATWAVIAMLRMQYLVHRWTGGGRPADTGRPRRCQRDHRSSSSGRRAQGGRAEGRAASRHGSQLAPPPPPPRPMAMPRPKVKVMTPRTVARSQSLKPAAFQAVSKLAARSSSPKRTSHIPPSKPMTFTPKRASHSPSPKKTDRRPFEEATEGAISPLCEEKQVRKDRSAVEFDVEEEEEELTPRPDGMAGSSLGELLDGLDEGIDEVLEMGDEEETPRSLSRGGGSTVVLDEGVSLPPSITPLISSDESEITKFFTDYGSQPLPDMEMECGTTGSMPNLAALDVRSVTTASDIESEELELYLAQFDSLLIRRGCSPRLSASSASQSSEYRR